ncbi:hypothetical protein [Sporomusa acidovorans]|uniref:Competence protein A n=1 Tax=Sporomusa acidovorans (strain ATCC 49682 / DSM 3132 / Mol) TaxID=1123286 RepID=A0ABZ3IW55_SPOA4|nr:hypothetical protein [Sporomusa acidovorans]OZC17993.1 hypothetical protein SPACI_36200 [Sporomusa acidovorans DSM 3132]SDF42346.1 Molecular chaperone DnaK (HSP70) [Sporomusa acidovorans]
MAGQLAVDFGNAYTVLAYWRRASRQAETLYLPGVTRPIPATGAGQRKRVFAAPSLIAYGEAAGECLIGQEAVESNLAERVFHDLQYDVLTGKRVYNLVGGRPLCGHDMARDYLALLLRRAGHALGLGSETALTFTMPLAACKSAAIWQRCRQWLEGTVRQAGFSRLEFIEEPWAAAWGAGMQIKPGEYYLVLSLNDAFIETAMIQAVNQAGGGSKRHIRVISYASDWLLADGDDPALQQAVLAIIRQGLREAASLGVTAEYLTGVVATGSRISAKLPAMVQQLFPAIALHGQRPWTAAACGAVLLTAGLAGCGYLRDRYTLRYLAGNSYQYRELVAQGTFYPSEGPVAECVIRASYDGQREFALWLYRNEDQCVNENNPLILVTALPAVAGQEVIHVKASLDGAGQLVVTAVELASGNAVANRIIAAKLI